MHILYYRATKNITDCLSIANYMGRKVSEPYDPRIRLHVYEDSVMDTYDAKFPDSTEPNLE